MRTLLTLLPYRRCRHVPSNGRRCRLPFGHATAHQDQPTLREFIAGWMYQGREGDERS